MKSTSAGATDHGTGATEPLIPGVAMVVALVLALAVGFENLRAIHEGTAARPLEFPPGATLLVALQVAWIPLGIASMFMWLVGRDWSDYGLERRSRRWRVLPGAVVAVLAAQALWRAGAFTFGPTTLPLAAGHGSVASLIGGTAVSVVLAASQELLARGFLLNETARLLQGRWAASVVLLSLVLAMGHLHRGGGAVLVAIGAHLVFGVLYLFSKRDLGLVVLAHSAAAVLLVAPAP